MKKSKIPSNNLWKKFGIYFPYPVVDLIILDKDDNFLMTKRAIPPYENKWHFPGGMIHKNITMGKAVKTVAKKEVNLEVKVVKFLGVYEFIARKRHDISHVFIVRILKGTINLDFQSNEAKFFKNPPKSMNPFHRKIFFDAKSFMIHNSTR